MIEGTALLQGLAVCGHCGRRLRTHYRGRNSTPGYHCAGKHVVNGRGVYCLNIGGAQIDNAVVEAFLAALSPAGVAAVVVAAEQLETDHDAALAQWQLSVERARYEAELAERRYRAVDPDNRLVARGLEAQWEQSLRALQLAEAQLVRRQAQRPRTLTAQERTPLQALGGDLARVWSAPTTSDRDRKELLRTLLEEVIIAVQREQGSAHLTLRWKGGLISEIDLHLAHTNPPPIGTDENTVELVRRLAVHYPDALIAGILNRQGRRSARGERFTADRVGNLRRYRKIPCFEPKDVPQENEPINIQEAAKILDIAPSTLHRWLNDGFVAGEQVTPGAPWRIRITDALKALFVEQAPEGYLPMREAIQRLGVSRQTVLQRVKRGELHAVHVRRGTQKGLRIKVIDDVPDLFDPLP